MAQENQLDRFVGWVEIGPHNDRFRIETLSAPLKDVTIIIPHGVYYLYKAGPGDPPDLLEKFPPFFTIMEGLLISQLGEGVAINRYGNPASKEVHVSRALRIWAPSRSSQSRWRWSSTSFDLRYLGFQEPEGTQLVNGDLTDLITFMYRGVWSPSSLLGGATDKRSYLKDEIRYSEEDLRRAYSLQIRKGKKRTFTYQYVVPQNVWQQRNLDPRYQAHRIHDLVGNHRDVNNTFEVFWSLWGQSDPVGLRPFLCVHDDGLSDLRVWNKSYEILIPSEPDEVNDIESCVRTQRVNGEFYEVSFSTWVLGGNYDY